MRITLYRNKSDNRVLNKDLEDSKAIEGVLKDGCSIVHPHFTIAGHNPDYLNGYNYLYYEELNRYYYIDNITYVRGGLIEIECSIDVLMTYRNDITALTALVERQESWYSPYLVDKGITINQGKVIKAINVGRVGDTEYTNYITCIGAVNEESEVTE